MHNEVNKLLGGFFTTTVLFTQPQDIYPMDLEGAVTTPYETPGENGIMSSLLT